MGFLLRRHTFAVLLAAILVLLVACGQAPLPTRVPAAATLPPPATPVPPRPTLPPPAIISVPSGASGATALSVPTGSTNSEVIVQIGAAGSALPEEIQRLLDDLASGALLLNSSPAGQGVDPVKYAYRDVNGDGSRDLVIVVVAEPVSHHAGDGPADQVDEAVQAIGINMEELIASISQNPDAPLVRSAFVYTLSQEELDEIEP